MIIFKKILFILSVIIFTSTSHNAANARDCSDPKGFHAKMACKFQEKSLNGETSSNDSASTIEKKRGPISGFFKKIRDFGGKNIGEEG